MAVSGDLRALSRLAERVAPERIRATVLPKVAQRMAATAVELLGDEFDKSRDPYGNAWQPLKYRKGKPLLKTARMARSRTAQASGPNVKVTITAGYAKYHQDGATVPARSNIRGRTLWHDPRTGRLVKRRTRLKLVVETKAKPATFGEFKIPRRQMLPDPSTGGLGPIWSAALRKDADDVLRKALGG